MPRMFRAWRLLAAATPLLLAACAPLHHKALSPEAKSRIRDVRIQVVVPQETFIFSANSPGAVVLGGGLIGALIDSGVQMNRQEAMRSQVRPVLDQLIDADFRAEASEALPAATPGFPLPVSRADVVAAMPSRKEWDSLLADRKDDAAHLRILVHYSVDLPTGALVTRSEVSLWQQGMVSPIFAGSAIYYGAPIPDPDPVPALRAQMRQSVAHTLKLAALDIAQPAGAGNRPRQSFVVKTGEPVTLQGEVLDSSGSRAFIRSAEGAMFSVER